jgi:hypothetical protein
MRLDGANPATVDLSKKESRATSRKLCAWILGQCDTLLLSPATREGSHSQSQRAGVQPTAKVLDKKADEKRRRLTTFSVVREKVVVWRKRRMVLASIR